MSENLMNECQCECHCHCTRHVTPPGPPVYNFQIEIPPEAALDFVADLLFQQFSLEPGEKGNVEGGQENQPDPSTGREFEFSNIRSQERKEILKNLITDYGNKIQNVSQSQRNASCNETEKERRVLPGQDFVEMDESLPNVPTQCLDLSKENEHHVTDTPDPTPIDPQVVLSKNDGNENLEKIWPVSESDDDIDETISFLEKTLEEYQLLNLIDCGAPDWTDFFPLEKEGGIDNEVPSLQEISRIESILERSMSFSGIELLECPSVSPDRINISVENSDNDISIGSPDGDSISIGSPDGDSISIGSPDGGSISIGSPVGPLGVPHELKNPNSSNALDHDVNITVTNDTVTVDRVDAQVKIVDFMDGVKGYELKNPNSSNALDHDVNITVTNDTVTVDRVDAQVKIVDLMDGVKGYELNPKERNISKSQYVLPENYVLLPRLEDFPLPEGIGIPGIRSPIFRMFDRNSAEPIANFEVLGCIDMANGPEIKIQKRRGQTENSSLSSSSNDDSICPTTDSEDDNENLKKMNRSLLRPISIQSARNQVVPIQKVGGRGRPRLEIPVLPYKRGRGRPRLEIPVLPYKRGRRRPRLEIPVLPYKRGRGRPRKIPRITGKRSGPRKIEEISITSSSSQSSHESLVVDVTSKTRKPSSAFFPESSPQRRSLRIKSKPRQFFQSGSSPSSNSFDSSPTNSTLSPRTKETTDDSSSTCSSNFSVKVARLSLTESYRRKLRSRKN